MLTPLARPPLLLLLALLPAPAARLHAQAPEQRAALEAFRDSLDATADSTGLLLLEKRLIAEAKENREEPMAHLRLGFLALRLAELGGASHNEDAASEFQWAIDLRPDWPYPYYGMGLAELAIGDSKVSVVAGLQTMFGKDALTRSAAAFAKSAEVDPSFVTGLVELANTSLRQRINIRTGVALDALRRAAATPAGASPELLLARGRIERAVGSPDSALAALRRYADTTRGSPLARFELGATRLWQGDPAGRDDWLAGAASDDAAVVALYREDLRPIGSDSILGEFDAQKGAFRRQWLERFWTERDQLDLRRPGERLAEHYRRLFYARTHFALVGRWTRVFDIAETYRSGSRDFDDRGIIYIRHGEPDGRAFYNVTGIALNEGLEINESWRYVRSDGDLLFHFVAREDVQDFRLVESLLDVLGYSRTVRLQTGDGLQADPVAEQLVISREQFAPVYQRMLQQGRMGLGRVIAEERAQGQASIRRGTSSDTYELTFARRLDASCQVLGVGRQDASPLAHVTCAVRGNALQPERLPDGWLYSLRLRLAVSDSAGRVVAAADTTRRFFAREPVPEKEYVVGLVTLPVGAPGAFRYRAALSSGDSAGVVFERDEVLVPPLQSARLVVSDLVLGRRDANVRWRPAEADTVFFNPLGTFLRREPLELYYELIGAAAGQEYETTLSVRKGGGRGLAYQTGRAGGGGSKLSLQFKETAPGGPWRLRRSVSLDRLSAGDYTLEVTVTSTRGVKETRRRAFRIVD
jgi:GWxTD domain-containing protein